MRPSLATKERNARQTAINRIQLDTHVQAALAQPPLDVKAFFATRSVLVCKLDHPPGGNPFWGLTAALITSLALARPEDFRDHLAALLVEHLPLTATIDEDRLAPLAGGPPRVITSPRFDGPAADEYPNLRGVIFGED